MCGLNILINGDEEMIREMVKSTMHRGVRHRIWRHKNLYVGHNRLPIIGLDKKWDHPIRHGQYKMWGVGEFFNFREIEPHAQNDFGTMLRQYAKRGRNAFLEMDGFWSVAIYDEYEQTIKVYVDYLAQKPLYLRMEGNILGISSEITPLRAMGPFTLNEHYMSSVAKWGYSVGTPFQEVTKIPAGMELSVNIKTGLISRHIFDKLEQEKRLNLRRNMKDSVRRRLIADVPIAVLCSGGLDSTIILKLVQEVLKESEDHPPITVVHTRMPGTNDTDYMRYLIDTDLNIEYVDLGDQPEYEQTIMRYNETPVDLGSVIPQWHMGRRVRSLGFNVALSGDGADELFGGYTRASTYDSQLSDIYDELVLYHLPRLDKMMMAHTVELRCPFLGRNVIQSALDIPYFQRTNKQYLKDRFSDIVPERILHRSKEALKTPYIKENKMKARLELIKKFRRFFHGSHLSNL